MKIVFFDGHCNLCNGFVSWLLAADRRGLFQVASLQGETARERLGEGAAGGDPETVVYLSDGRRFERSAAVLHIVGDLGGWRRLIAISWLLPAPLRDGIYRLVARNRYRLFGRRETCRLPTEAERGRFLP